ncbi:two-component sensor histidine kinase [Pelagibacterium lentulum]|uniref:histidine kinase n=2 Tax=Pelagibacterium lentulum TaxID=2029865 RepID=A0A916W3C5_9HYPH|nr:two-component sensor histidine kinase [Pelagibacterium lentulum]
MLVGGAAVVLAVALVALGRLEVMEGVLIIAAMSIITTIAARSGMKSDDGTLAKDADPDLDPSVTRFADTLTEPCLVINERAVLAYCNPAAQMQFPRAREGDPLAFTLRNPELVEAIDKAFETGENQRAELHLTVPNETWYRASVVPYRPVPDAAPLFLVITLYDLTEQKRIDKMRGDFIANASHELRTPLTSLMGFIETLQGPAARDEMARARFLGIMKSQSERMSGLIDDLLSLSRIELRQHVKPTESVNLDLLVREVAESLEARASEAGVVLNLELPKQSLSAVGDRQELFEVVENLLDNAIKYGGSGKKVDIALVPDMGRSGDHLGIIVTDYGPGIAEEHVPRLTERFYRVDADSSRKKKGTGLGLAIVKHIVARHHGQMSIRSKLGEGTRVEILLPR